MFVHLREHLLIINTHNLSAGIDKKQKEMSA